MIRDNNRLVNWREIPCKKKDDYMIQSISTNKWIRCDVSLDCRGLDGQKNDQTRKYKAVKVKRFMAVKDLVVSLMLPVTPFA